jgi:enolase-phosphatase E1
LKFAVSAVLLDIEGTISSTVFVRETLFGCSSLNLPAFAAAHEYDPGVAAILEAAKKLSGWEDALAALIDRQDRDEKAPPLKAIQGLIWESGYASGAFRSPLFADALAGLRRWRLAGLPPYVYSSGSLKAQELFFRYNEAGDLRSPFAGHFNTAVGAKIDAASYARLAQAIGAPAQEILFLSDNIRELAAARDAGFQIAQVVKEQNRPDASSQILMDFDASELAPQTSVGLGPK